MKLLSIINMCNPIRIGFTMETMFEKVTITFHSRWCEPDSTTNILFIIESLGDVNDDECEWKLFSNQKEYIYTEDGENFATIKSVRMLKEMYTMLDTLSGMSNEVMRGYVYKAILSCFGSHPGQYMDPIPKKRMEEQPLFAPDKMLRDDMKNRIKWTKKWSDYITPACCDSLEKCDQKEDEEDMEECNGYTD